MGSLRFRTFGKQPALQHLHRAAIACKPHLQLSACSVTAAMLCAPNQAELATRAAPTSMMQHPAYQRHLDLEEISLHAFIVSQAKQCNTEVQILPSMVYWAYSMSLQSQKRAALVYPCTGFMSSSNIGHIPFAKKMTCWVVWPGGVAGVSSWLAVYPLDTLKARLQATPAPLGSHSVPGEQQVWCLSPVLARWPMLQGCGQLIQASDQTSNQPDWLE